MKRQDLTYGPFRVILDEDDKGDLKCTAEIRGKMLFYDVPYHEVSFALFLIDEAVAQELGLEDK